MNNINLTSVDKHVFSRVVAPNCVVIRSGSACNWRLPGAVTRWDDKAVSYMWEGGGTKTGNYKRKGFKTTLKLNTKQHRYIR